MTFQCHSYLRSRTVFCYADYAVLGRTFHQHGSVVAAAGLGLCIAADSNRLKMRIF